MAGLSHPKNKVPTAETKTSTPKRLNNSDRPTGTHLRQQQPLAHGLGVACGLRSAVMVGLVAMETVVQFHRRLQS